MRLLRQLKRAKNKKGNAIYNLVDYLYYLYKRNNWIFDIERYWKDFENIRIQKPVFLLGTHGGGLTLISRMIRRNKNFISVSGNYKYWSGADEMAVVLGPILPPGLAGIKHKLPEESDLNSPTNWLYATDENLEYFRKTNQDVTPEVKKRFRKILRWQIARYAINESAARFTDKSQIYTIKVSFLNEILKDTDPKFLLITRNPYAICYGVAQRNSWAFKNNGLHTYEEKLEATCQHWRNSMKCALEDGREIENFMSLKFENILESPEEKLKEICNFIEMEFDKDLLPQPEHKIPFGSKGKHKWYPLRPDVNQKYFDKMSQEDVEHIHSLIGETARKLNYNKPNL